LSLYVIGINHSITKQAQKRKKENKIKKPKKEFRPVNLVEKPADRDILIFSHNKRLFKREVLVRAGGVKLT